MLKDNYREKLQGKRKKKIISIGNIAQNNKKNRKTNKETKRR